MKEIEMNRGEQVEVRCRYTGGWAPGFEIDEVVGAAYQLRRRSDGAVLPELTGEADIRPDRSYQTT